MDGASASARIVASESRLFADGTSGDPGSMLRAMFSKDILAIDAAAVAQEIEKSIVATVMGTLKRRGAVIGISGGIDSSVVTTLCTRALGPKKVLGIFMPERASSGDS